MDKKIPFNRPFIVGKELFYISQAVLGDHLAGDGRFSKACEGWMEENFSARKVLLTTSCTSALEIAAHLAKLKSGDEVILPAYTYVSTANPFIMQGAKVRFVDIRPDTLNIDETLIESEITPNTKAIVPMHYAGIACDMDAIMEIALKHNLLVIEDAAQGVDATYNDKYLGTIGNFGAYSFHETKNFISGEGGAVVINDESFIERSEVIREKGTNRSKFFRGEIKEYTWIDVGSSYLPSELVAAFLWAQLEASELITTKRWSIFKYYDEHFRPLQHKGVLRIPTAPPGCRHNAHMYYLIMPDRQSRDGLIKHLKEKNITAVFHYIPLHTSPMGQKMGYKAGDLPVTENLSQRILRLPCYYELTPEDQDRVIAAVFEFVGM